MARCFDSFEEFWPFYVAEHARPATRALHFLGLVSLLPLLVVSFTVWPWAVLLYPLLGYGCAWLGHWLIERNRPATFSHPWWSLRGDLRMFRLILSGRMRAETDACLERECSRADTDA